MNNQPQKKPLVAQLGAPKIERGEYGKPQSDYVSIISDILTFKAVDNS